MTSITAPPFSEQPAPARPQTVTNPILWVRKNLFQNWFNTALTVVVVAVAGSLVVQFFQWATGTAQWAVVTENFRLLMQGIYPVDQSWRPALSVIIAVVLAGLSWGIWGRMARPTVIAFVLGVILFILIPRADRAIWGESQLGRYMTKEVTPLVQVLQAPVIALVICLGAGYIAGRGFRALDKMKAGRVVIALWFLAVPVTFILVRGIAPNTPGLPLVPTIRWGGLLLTFMMAFVASVCSFPLGALLALGRVSGGSAAGRIPFRAGWWRNPLQWLRGLASWWSSLGNFPVIKLSCVLYIELVRGVPLVAVFFMASQIVPLALGDASIDNVVRAMVALTVFEAAYIAEIVRGGLQAIPLGQVEAAKAIGLGPVLTTLFITLPQALRIVIPTLVGQFITMFKDTSLVVLISLLDLIGTARSVQAQAEFQENAREIYVFVAIVYFVFCYSMSQAARQLERTGSGALRRL